MDKNPFLLKILTVCLKLIYVQQNKNQCDLGFLIGWFGLWCLTRHFQQYSVISWQSVLLVEENRLPKKTTDHH